MLNKEKIDHCLYLVAKELKKKNKGVGSPELILIGGASVIINYGFRTNTTDIDSLMTVPSELKDVINKVGDDEGLPTGWLNDDFKKTASYSTKLYEVSKFYKTFCNYLTVRTVTGGPLIAMKIKAERRYKHDLSDIIGIISSMRESRMDISTHDVIESYKKLYDEPLPEGWKEKLDEYFTTKDIEELFYETVAEESRNKEALLRAEKEYKDVVNEKNVNEFIEHFTKVPSKEYDLKEMEQQWDAFFALPKPERRVITWEGREYRIAAFEDLYLSKCKEKGVSAAERISQHFWKNCVEKNGYEPKYFSRGIRRLS